MALKPPQIPLPQQRCQNSGQVSKRRDLRWFLEMVMVRWKLLAIDFQVKFLGQFRPQILGIDVIDLHIHVLYTSTLPYTWIHNFRYGNLGFSWVKFLNFTWSKVEVANSFDRTWRLCWWPHLLKICFTCTFGWGCWNMERWITTSQHYRLDRFNGFRCTGKLLPDAGVSEALDCQGAQEKVHEQQRGENPQVCLIVIVSV